MNVVASTLFGFDLIRDKAANQAFVVKAKKAFEEFNFVNPLFIIFRLF